jgi:hypothetical protein
MAAKHLIYALLLVLIDHTGTFIPHTPAVLPWRLAKAVVIGLANLLQLKLNVVNDTFAGYAVGASLLVSLHLVSACTLPLPWSPT